MRDVVTTSAVFFSYALLAVFAQNAVFTRALGVSRLVQLVGDDRTSSWLFGMQLCITQVLVTPFAGRGSVRDAVPHVHRSVEDRETPRPSSAKEASVSNSEYP